MIALFRKHIALTLRSILSTGACAGMLAAGVAAQAQVATRTQLAAQHTQGNVLSLTANVAGAAGESISEGSVSFETPKGSLGSVFVHNGTATLNLTNPPQWATNITAVYHGDAAFASSVVSAAVTAQASGIPGFTVTASPSSLSLKPGQYGTVNLTITSQNGFSEAVNLSCSSLPNGTACTFNPDVAIPAANSSTISAMQISTQGNSGILSSRLQGRGAGVTWAFVIPGALALVGMGAIRRRNIHGLRAIGLVLLLGAGSLGLSSCAARYNYLHYKPSPNLGTAAGNYTIVVSAFSSNGTAVTNATSTDPNCSGAVCVALTVQ